VGDLITFASLLWDKNSKSEEFSTMYDETWAVKLFNGFRRHCSMPYRCVLYVDRERKLPGNIEQIVVPGLGLNGYGDCTYPYRENRPMILVGLDTIVLGSVDKFCRWALEHPGKLALPKHPYEEFSINGVSVWGGGNPDIFGKWRGENDMKWIRQFPHERTDELWPGKIASWRAHVKPQGDAGKVRIMYHHGREKPHELLHIPLIRDNWK
jgi:hypothetical protein